MSVKNESNLEEEIVVNETQEMNLIEVEESKMEKFKKTAKKVGIVAGLLGLFGLGYAFGSNSNKVEDYDDSEDDYESNDEE